MNMANIPIFKNYQTRYVSFKTERTTCSTKLTALCHLNHRMHAYGMTQCLGI